MENLSEWEEVKNNIWADFLKDGINTISIQPTAVYLGCEFANHQRMNEHIEYNKDIPVYWPNKKLMEGVAPIIGYKHVDLLNLLIRNETPVYITQKHPHRFKIQSTKIDAAKVLEVANAIKSVKYTSYKSVDVLKL